MVPLPKAKFNADPRSAPTTHHYQHLDPAAESELVAAEKAWNALGPIPVVPTDEQVAVCVRYVRASRGLYRRPRAAA
jgi:hypothetical protein